MENNSQIKYIVYCTTCLINNFIYVGVHETNKPYGFDGYLGNGCYINQPSSYERSKNKFQQAVKLFGPKNFHRKTLAVFDNIDEALLLEAEIVNEEFLTRNDVYNMALGGNVGNYNLTGIKVYQYSEKGEFIAEYRSINYAAKAVNRNMRSLWRALNDKCKCANYFWTKEKFDILDLTKMKLYSGKECISVYQYNKLGEFECCYDSIKQASKVLNINDSNIGTAIKLGNLCHNKYFTSVYAPTYDVAKSNQIISLEIHQYDLEGNYIKSYKNMLLAKNELGVKTNIYKAIKLGQTCNGFQWSFEKLPKIAKVLPKSGKARPIGKFDKEGNLLETYKSLAECKRINGSGMVHVLSGRDKYAKGYVYKYMDELKILSIED